MKFLITGGKGFIGSYIVEQLSKDHQVTVFDSSDTYGILSKEELFKIINDPATYLKEFNHAVKVLREHFVYIISGFPWDSILRYRIK